MLCSIAQMNVSVNSVGNVVRRSAIVAIHNNPNYSFT